ncbi:hypothetical protein D9M70_280200 [compost metagenome]
MTFYLEAIASDATALLPLLKNNAEGFRLLGDQAAAVGAILDNDTIRAAAELQAVSMLTDQALAGVRNQIASGLLPALAGLAEQFFDVTASGAGFTEVGETVGKVLKFIASSAVGAYTTVQLVGKGIAGLAYIASKIPEGLDAVRAAAGEVGDELDATAQSAATMIEKINNAGSSGEVGGIVSKLADILELAGKRTASAGIVIDQNTEKTQKATAAVQSQIEALQLQAATLGMTTKQETLFKLALEGATQAQLDQASAALDAVDAFERQKKAQEDYKGVVSELRTEEEQLTDQLKERLRIIEAMPDLPEGERREQTRRAIDASFTDAPEFAGLDPSVAGPVGELMKVDTAAAELEDWYAKQLEMLEENRRAKADMTAEWDAKELEIKAQHEQALADLESARQTASLAAAGNLFGNLANLAKTFYGEQSGLYKAAFAAQQAMAIAQTIINTETAATAALAPPPIGLGPQAGAIYAQVIRGMGYASAALIGAQTIAGQAHDGIMSIPEDGTWNLKKGERVTTSETSAKLDATLDRVQAVMAGSRSGGGNTIIINQPNVKNGKDARDSSAATQRAVARGVAGSARYS